MYLRIFPRRDSRTGGDMNITGFGKGVEEDGNEWGGPTGALSAPYMLPALAPAPVALIFVAYASF